MGLLLLTFAAAPGYGQSVSLSGEQAKWHPITLTFTGPDTSEDATPNPFLDYRLEVAFEHGDRRYLVPGFYAADGNAAESGAPRGNKWQVRFTPDAEGEWRYVASFRTGKDIAIEDEFMAGDASSFDGAAGTFTVSPTGKNARGFHAAGRLEYVGRHHLRLAESGTWWLKGGADSPENFLAYVDFDGTYSNKNRQGRAGEAAPAPPHRYAPHVRDWREGDPVWRGGKGKGMIGALNYLAAQGMNSVYFLTMNVGGDGNDVWPWTSPDERLRFDCSKLDQWEIVFSHMDRLGIQLHVVTQETENDQLLDGGELGRQRKLYYRELIARFSHHLAITWNLGEENTNTDAQRKAFARYLRAVDPYDHPVVVHTYPGKYDEVYNPLLGLEHLEGPSLQTNQTHEQTIRWIDRSAKAGRPWVVCLDEIGPADTGVKPDADDPGHDEVRRRHLWGNLMAGGGGVEWYFGYKFAHNDLNLEDWRSRERMWEQTRRALEFFHRHLPFGEMRHADSLTDNRDDYCFAKAGEVYAVYLPRITETRLSLDDAKGAFQIGWYNPRAGGELQTGSVTTITGPGRQALGFPPGPRDQDWVALVKRRE